MIDWARVADLRGEVGTEGFDEVVTMFMEETDETIRRLNSRQGEAGLEELLHFLKGSALNLGFTAVSRLCHEGERLAAAGRGAEVDLVQLTDSYESARRLFLDGLQRLPPI